MQGAASGNAFREGLRSYNAEQDLVFMFRGFSRSDTISMHVKCAWLDVDAVMHINIHAWLRYALFDISTYMHGFRYALFDISTYMHGDVDVIRLINICTHGFR